MADKRGWRRFEMASVLVAKPAGFEAADLMRGYPVACFPTLCPVKAKTTITGLRAPARASPHDRADLEECLFAFAFKMLAGLNFGAMYRIPWADFQLTHSQSTSFRSELQAWCL